MHGSLNKEQQIAMLHKEGPLLVLAGAGSGKTRIVTQRILHLIEEGVSPSAILAVTFTNKAAGEMRERIHSKSIQQGASGMPMVCTFHSLGVHILRSFIDRVGFQSGFTIYDTEDAEKLLRGCIQSLSLSKEAATFKTMQNLISTAKNQLQSPQDMDLSELEPALQRSFAALYALYQERLKEANAVDFDDLLFLPIRLFREHLDVLAYYQARWRYLLIDEYQDTNHAQYLLAKLLVAQTQNIFAVGDPDQSIYSWRGANIQNILNFEKDYPGTRIIRLEQNYRSCNKILQASNALIRNNLSRYEKNLWSARGEGDHIQLHVASSDRDEANFVIEEIRHLHAKEKIPRSDMAVFYRTNFQSRTLEDALLRYSIPYVIVGGISFYHRKEVKDVLAFLHMLLSDTDFIAFSRTIHLPKRGIGETSIEKLREGAHQEGTSILNFCRQVALGETAYPLRLSVEQKRKLGEYVALIYRLREVARGADLAKVLEETIHQSNYLALLKEEKETYEDRKANVAELISKAVEWEREHPSPTLTTFLEELALATSLDATDGDQDAVNLMTFHNGKGLEFDTVFLVGMEEDLFPHANSRDRHEAVEEERRLCYVGMTRAKERLYLSAAETRFIWGSYRKMRPSRFLRELPKQYLERIL